MHIRADQLDQAEAGSTVVPELLQELCELLCRRSAPSGPPSAVSDLFFFDLFYFFIFFLFFLFFCFLLLVGSCNK